MAHFGNARALRLAVLCATSFLTVLPVLAQERPGDRPDLTPYNRPLVAGEGRALSSTIPGSLVDLVVAVGLGGTDVIGDTETSIAIDPSNPNHITISAFSGFWGGAGSTAPLWVSNDGGTTWAKVFSLAVPTLLDGDDDADGCPCDQTFDYGKSGGILYGSTLGVGSSDEPTWSGDTANVQLAASWQWLVSGGTTATTSHTTFSDQPWLVVNRDPVTASQDDVYVGYTDYGVGPPADHIAFSLGVNPPSFPAGQDVVVGTSAGTGFLASGAVRIAGDPQSGTIYATWEDSVTLDLSGAPASCPRTIDFRLSRSTDHGQTWTLNGSSNGILLATNQSDEGWPDDPNGAATACRTHNEKFGTVNALLGGSEAIAVDPLTGDVYVALHNRDQTTGNNRLDVIRLVANGTGGLMIKSVVHAVGQVNAALPSLAVAESGVVALLYTQYDGIVTGFPQFETRLTQSVDQGATWTDDRLLLTFLSPTNSNGNSRQRVLGDYQQLKTVGNFFYAAFPGNGAAAGRTTSNIDPFFYKVMADMPSLPDLSTALAFYTLTPCRLLDTRNPDGRLGGPALAAGSTRTFALTGSCGVPSTAKSLAVNITVTQALAAGDLQLYAGGTTAPLTSVLNFQAGETRANNAVVTLGSAGDVAIYLQSAGSTQVLLDVNGYFQ